MENICRTCMLNKAKLPEMELEFNEIKMTSIFNVPEEYEEENLSIMELIKISVPQLKIDNNDILPKYICQRCLEKITDIYNFQQKCLNIEDKLYKMLKEGDLMDSENSTEHLELEVIKTELINDVNFNDNTYNGIIEDEISLHCGSTVNDENKKVNRTRCSKRNIKKAEAESEFTEKTKNNSITRKAKSKLPKTEEMYPCDKCQRKLISKLSLIKHQEMHLKKAKEELEFKCSICEEEFTESALLKNHQKTHTAEKPFLCSACGKGFTSAGSLKQHSFRHLDKKLYPCSECPKSFPTKGDLLCHSETHNAKPRIHVCDVCGRGFHKPFLLKQHQRYHNNERPFACDFCEKRFVTSEKQQRHMRIHTGEKPYRCKYCDRAFAQSNDCIKHLRQHLGDNVYQCELCPLRFPLARDLRAHFASHKDDDDETRARNQEARLEEERKLQIQIFVREN
ncbi:uncharacterized protein ACRADG_006388 isoform 2-T2 [Cochliomyia hominivorax]